MLVIDICVMHVTDVCSHMSSAVADSDADDSSKLQTNHNRWEVTASVAIHTSLIAVYAVVLGLWTDD